MTTLAHRLRELGNLESYLPEVYLVDMVDTKDKGVPVYYAVFHSEADRDKYDRMSPAFAGFNKVYLCGNPAFELGVMH